MNNPSSLDPTMLTEARTLCHLACQWPSKAARANLAPADDDSHSNLGWQSDFDALVSHPLDDGQRRIQLGFSFSARALVWLVDGAVNDQLELRVETEASVKEWVDRHLASVSLQSTDKAVMPYELEDEADYSKFVQQGGAVSALGAWFGYGQQGMAHLIKEFGGRCVESPTIRCWPHHFDIGSLFVLETGDPETARSIGVGLAPGDTSFDEPYFYCSPYPAPNTDGLPPPAEPLFWNTAGFVSVILRSSKIDKQTDLNPLLDSAFSSALQTV
jgi:hypothetical protein